MSIWLERRRLEMDRSASGWKVGKCHVTGGALNGLPCSVINASDPSILK